MATNHLFKIQPALGMSLLIYGLIFTSCGSKSNDLSRQEAPTSSANKVAADSATDSKPQASAQSVASKPKPEAPSPAAPPVVQTLPQLIKTADISVKVKSIEPALIEIKKLVKQTKGDIYKFEDQKPNDNDSHHRITMEIKVPQSELDNSLEKISKLGSIENQKVKAEDVTNQLVDIDARLKNLRQEETTIGKILERTDSIRDVLSVSKELSRVRAEIEEIDATQKSLRGRVAYSTINLNLEESVATIKDAGNPLGVRVGESWNNSTHAAGELTTNLVLLLVSLIPFIPIFLLGGGAFYLYRRAKPKLKNQPTPELEQPEQ